MTYFWTDDSLSCPASWTHTQEAGARLRSSILSASPGGDVSVAQEKQPQSAIFPNKFQFTNDNDDNDDNDNDIGSNNYNHNLDALYVVCAWHSWLGSAMLCFCVKSHYDTSSRYN